MRTLFIDLASHSTEPGQGACMACVSDDKTESILFIDHRIGDDGLMPVFDGVLKEAGCVPNDLTQIACVVGPGGFTSLRMAVALANALADQLDIPSVGMHLSDLYKARVKPQASGRKHDTNMPEALSLPPESFLWIHATKKDAVFIKGFGAYATQWSEPMLVSIDDLMSLLPAQVPVAGEILPEQREKLAGKIADIPLQTVAETLPGLLRQQHYAKNLLMPWYGRGW